MLFFWTFNSSKNIENKNIKLHTVFNISDNKKCFSSSKSRFYNDLKSEENSVAVTWITTIIEYIEIENSYL